MGFISLNKKLFFEAIYTIFAPKKETSTSHLQGFCKKFRFVHKSITDIEIKS